SDIVGKVSVHLRAERRVVPHLSISALELEDERHERLGDEAAAVGAEVPAIVGPAAEGVGLVLDPHAPLARRCAPDAAASRAARMNARIVSGSFSPGARSTPDETSTAGARVIRNASATLSASRPPESMNGTPGLTPCRSCQSKLFPSPPGRVASR